MRLALAAVALSACAFAQTPALTNKQSQDLMARSIQLMESSAVAIPELARAGAPLAENARQALNSIRVTSGLNLQFIHTFDGNLRAYLLLADALPKPATYTDEARQQLAELRDNYHRLDAWYAQRLAQGDRELRSPDRDELARYAAADRQLPPPQTGRPRVVFLGDSITDGWRLNEYFPDRDFVNRGISGQITGEMLGRMMADVVNLHPAAVLILGGTNDIARGVPLATIENNLTMITDLASFYKIRVILASVTPVSDYHKNVEPRYEMTRTRPPDLIRSLNGWIRGICNERGYTYLDYFDALVDSSGFLKADLADDGLHPNSGGYRIMAPLALAAIDKTVGTAAAPQPKERRRRLFRK